MTSYVLRYPLRPQIYEGAGDNQHIWRNLMGQIWMTSQLESRVITGVVIRPMANLSRVG